MRQLNLKACQQRCDALLRREADDDAGDTRGSDDRGAELPHRLKHHQHRGNGENGNHDGRDLLEDHHLRVHRASDTVVRHVDAVAGEHEVGEHVDELQQQEPDRADEQEAHGVLNHDLHVGGNR